MTADGTKTVVAETDKTVSGLNLTDGKVLWKVPFPVPGMRNYNSSTPLVQGDTVTFSGSNRGTRAVKVEKKDGAFAAKELWNNKETSVIHNSPVVKNGHVFGLTGRDELFCVSAETGKTTWTEPLGGGGGRGGYGNIVDAGDVMLALPPNAQLTVFEPSGKEFKKLASYKVGATKTYAYPVATGNRLFVKDDTSVILWTVE
jgi:outer membrane protein assembly factor BamB